MRYKLPTDRVINQLIPHFLSGRKYILYLQSLIYPLKTLNDRFVILAREKHLEARMTSQIMYFEWYLNYKLGKYLVEKDNKIFIQDSISLGVDLYPENSKNGRPFTIWYQGEIMIILKEEETPREFYLYAEEKAINKVSFMVCVPQLKISEKEFVYMLSYIVNTYKIAGKTYLIKIDSTEYEPNNNKRL